MMSPDFPVSLTFSSTLQRTMRRLGLTVAAASTLAACKPFEVAVQAKDTIKVDVNIKLDVYQYAKDQKATGSTAASASPATPPPSTVQRDADAVLKAQLKRSGDIQTFKNNRLVGENHRGLLTVKERPAGAWGDYVERVVNEENDDRIFLMTKRAQDENAQLHDIQAREWKIAVEKAFENEWIEVPGERPETFQWIAKKRKS